MIAVVDFGISNLNSVVNALRYLGLKYVVSDKEDEIMKASHIIMPGVGTFEAGMRALKEKNLLSPLKDQISCRQIPILGICLGMQLLFCRSDESPRVEGMRILSGSVLRLPPSNEYTVPRIGWAESIANKDFLFLRSGHAVDLYYIHSYYVTPTDNSIVAISTEKNNITGAIQKDNIYGCQFHPEKSHKAGLRMLEAFVKS